MSEQADTIIRQVFKPDITRELNTEWAYQSDEQKQKDDRSKWISLGERGIQLGALTPEQVASTLDSAGYLAGSARRLAIEDRLDRLNALYARGHGRLPDLRVDLTEAVRNQGLIVIQPPGTETTIAGQIIGDPEFQALIAERRHQMMAPEYFNNLVTERVNEAVRLEAERSGDSEAVVRADGVRMTTISNGARGESHVEFARQMENIIPEQTNKYITEKMKRANNKLDVAVNRIKDETIKDALRTLYRRWRNRGNLKTDFDRLLRGNIEQILVDAHVYNPIDRQKLLHDSQFLKDLRAHVMTRRVFSGGKINQHEFDQMVDEDGIDAITKLVKDSTRNKGAIAEMKKNKLLPYTLKDDLLGALLWVWKNKAPIGIAGVLLGTVFFGVAPFLGAAKVGSANWRHGLAAA